MAEWSNAAVSKTVIGFAYQGFESLPLRHCCIVLGTLNPRRADVPLAAPGHRATGAFGSTPRSGAHGWLIIARSGEGGHIERSPLIYARPQHDALAAWQNLALHVWTASVCQRKNFEQRPKQAQMLQSCVRPLVLPVSWHSPSKKGNST